jgi:hypothetical protein
MVFEMNDPVRKINRVRISSENVLTSPLSAFKCRVEEKLAGLSIVPVIMHDAIQALLFYVVKRFKHFCRVSIIKGLFRTAEKPYSL